MAEDEDNEAEMMKVVHMAVDAGAMVHGLADVALKRQLVFAGLVGAVVIEVRGRKPEKQVETLGHLIAMFQGMLDELKKELNIQTH